ncbi:MAG: HAMP domain-containing protein [Candidatus Omnitrophota bacterium]|nr:HAMP domain-containing protein [Candidatus Omnitrophota bacterium]
MSVRAKRTYRRAHWLVNPALQFRFIRALLLTLLAMTVTVVLGIGLALWYTLYSYELLKEAYIVALFNTVSWTVVMELIVLVPVIGWVGILLTHRVVGPLVRIRASLSEMAKGNFDVHITLRKGDALTELAEDINRLAESLRNRSTS